MQFSKGLAAVVLLAALVLTGLVGCGQPATPMPIVVTATPDNPQPVVEVTRVVTATPDIPATVAVLAEQDLEAKLAAGLQATLVAMPTATPTPSPVPTPTPPPTPTPIPTPTPVPTPTPTPTTVPTPTSMPTPRPTRTPQPTPAPTAVPTATPNYIAQQSLADRISYDDLFRNNEKHVGKLVFYQGKVIQVLEDGSGKYQLRANVTKVRHGWDDTVFLYYSGSRLLEDDIIKFVGVVQGLITYESTSGASITIPAIRVNVVELVPAASSQTRAPTSTPFPNPNPVDVAALTALYNALDGPNWKGYGNWLEEPWIGRWGGVTADSNGRVTRIELKLGELRGTIPPEIGDLSELTHLDLSNNHLTGPIPAELGSLSKLAYLNLSQNQLTRDIPPELGNLSNLTILHLERNRLTGDIPPELGNLSSIVELHLWQNRLTGQLPQTLANPMHLETLYIHRNAEACLPISMIDWFWRLRNKGADYCS